MSLNQASNRPNWNCFYHFITKTSLPLIVFHKRLQKKLSLPKYFLCFFFFFTRKQIRNALHPNKSLSSNAWPQSIHFYDLFANCCAIKTNYSLIILINNNGIHIMICDNMDARNDYNWSNEELNQLINIIIIKSAFHIRLFFSFNSFYDGAFSLSRSIKSVRFEW